MSFKRKLALMMAFVFALVSLFALARAESDGETAASSDPVKIWEENDAGDMIVRIQLRLRELGYLCFRPTGVFRSMTVKAAEAFQKRCSNLGYDIAIDGRVGPATLELLFSHDAPKVKIPDSVHMPRGPVSDIKVTGTATDWLSVKQVLVPGTVCTVYDCYTDESMQFVFTGGENHAEMELASAGEKETFDMICGGEYNFLKRPVVVVVGGTNVAASMQCWPHGSDTRDGNGMEGHVCVFFSGSLSHVGKLPDAEHSANVNLAAGR